MPETPGQGPRPVALEQRGESDDGRRHSPSVARNREPIRDVFAAEGLVAGRGWIALALTTFATWRPLRVLLGAYLFGGVTMLQFWLQTAGVAVASQLLAMLPYLATIVVLALISRNPAWIRANMPASLGRPFHPGA